MPSNSNPPYDQTKYPTRHRLITAAALIALAIGALALVDQFRGRPPRPAPAHEPSLALITTPAPDSDATPGKTTQDADPAPPPNLVSNEMVAPPRPPDAAAPSSPAGAKGRTQGTALATGKAYLVQVGIFNSPVNAQALQKQLQHAGLQARLETRVQLGPFKDKRDADKALARARKLGIDAVLVGSR
jgi:DedD protein